METITLNNIKTQYTVEGNGKPMIFLHGWGGNIQSFDKLKPYFTKKYKVYILDLPGFGGSKEPFEPWDVSKYKDFVIDFADIFNIKKFIVLGHSFGGRVSIKLASENPDKLYAMVLLASAGIKPKYSLWKKFLYCLSKAGKKVFELPLISKVKRYARKFLYKLAGSRDYLEVSGVMKKTFQSVIKEDLKPLLRTIKTKTFLGWGKKDNKTPISDGITMHKEIRASQLFVLDDARHGIHKQEPGVLSERILEFLSFLDNT